MLFSKPSADWLIVGLGNPGRQYDRTRHNAGFRAMEALARRLGCPLDRVKFQGRMGQCAHGGQKLVLLLPQTFMNLSGNAVAEAVRFYRLPPERVLVLCDDISLEPGRLRVRGSGSAGGHNGLKSIIARLGSQDFPRVKIGVGAKRIRIMIWPTGSCPPSLSKRRRRWPRSGTRPERLPWRY